MRFSKELIDETREYFRKLSGLTLTDSQASAYLEKLGALGMVVCDMLTASEASPPAALRQTMGLRGPMATQASGGRHSGGAQPVTLHPETPVDGDN